jgi:organic radical activating enzyme
MKRSELKNLIKEAIEEVKPQVAEDKLNEGFAPEVDEVGAFWVVEKPSISSTIDDICFECKDVAYFANQVKGGLYPADIKGIFTKEAKAKKLAEKLLADLDKKKTEVKKAAESYKKMKDEAMAKVQEYMKNKKATKDVVDELKDVAK